MVNSSRPVVRRGLRLVSTERGLIIDGGARRVRIAVPATADTPLSLVLADGSLTIEEIAERTGGSPDKLRESYRRLRALGLLYLRADDTNASSADSPASQALDRISGLFGIEDPALLTARLSATRVALRVSEDEALVLEQELDAIGCEIVNPMSTEPPPHLTICDATAVRSAVDGAAPQLVIPVAARGDLMFVGPVLALRRGPCIDCFLRSIDAWPAPDAVINLSTRARALMWAPFVTDRVMRWAAASARRELVRKTSIFDMGRFSAETVLLFGEATCGCDPAPPTGSLNVGAARLEAVQADDPSWRADGAPELDSWPQTAQSRMARDELPGLPRYPAGTAGSAVTCAPSLERAESLLLTGAVLDVVPIIRAAFGAKGHAGNPSHRRTPSGGGLASQEAYLVAPRGLGSDDLVLVKYCDLDDELAEVGIDEVDLELAWSVVCDQCPSAHAAIIGCCATWRLARKYGAPALRTGLLDAGVAYLQLELAALAAAMQLSPVDAPVSVFGPVLQEEDSACAVTFVAAVARR